MSAMQAVYENGVFRPVQPVHLPVGTRVLVELDAKADERIEAARQRTRETLSRSYDTDEPGDILETHNDHQP